MKRFRVFITKTLFFSIAAIVPLSLAQAENMMEKSHSMMMKKEENQSRFTEQEFAKAQADGTPFLLAFHKKGCPLCASQQKALEQVFTTQGYDHLKVIVVDYDNDTESLKKFKVGQQGTLILYKGDKEVSRKQGLTTAKGIIKQLES